MGKEFNVTGACNPRHHYMVDITERLDEIKTLIDKGAYFTVNRARQYGKTTTLTALKSYLKDRYTVVYMDFQFMSDDVFKTESGFAMAFADELGMEAEIPQEISDELAAIANGSVENVNLRVLFKTLSNWCKVSDKPVVLIIDEVDSASNNQVFLDLLAQLRGYYLHREYRPAFQSVILAGVYDIKNLKQKIRSDSEMKTNSPWNIAADFDVDMSLSKEGIAGMLKEYEDDHKTGMDISEIAGLIHEYTMGYPFLVSRICQLIEKKAGEWTKKGFLEAVKILTSEKNALFDSLMGKIEDDSHLRDVVYSILFDGEKRSYNSDDSAIYFAQMFGFVKNENGNITIANRIFETRLYNYFLASEERVGSQIYKSGQENKNRFIQNGHLDMSRVLEKFVETFDYLYGDENEKFVEEIGRKYFLLFLKPIINGVGNCYIEAQTRNMRRTDVIVDYNGEQFIVELKIWKGDKYNSDGEQQIAEYINYYHLKKGYMLTFSFNKNKQIGVKEVQYGDVTIIEAVV
jgi:hypothetical protein